MVMLFDISITSPHLLNFISLVILFAIFLLFTLFFLKYFTYIIPIYKSFQRRGIFNVIRTYLKDFFNINIF